MIRLFKQFADWLDNRFPPKFHVTNAMFDSFVVARTKEAGRISTLELENEILSKRIGSLEKSLNSIKELLAKGGATIVKTDADKLRDQFVRGEYVRGPSPESLVIADRG